MTVALGVGAILLVLGALFWAAERASRGYEQNPGDLGKPFRSGGVAPTYGAGPFL